MSGDGGWVLRGGWAGSAHQAGSTQKGGGAPGWQQHAQHIVPRCEVPRSADQLMCAQQSPVQGSAPRKTTGLLGFGGRRCHCSSSAIAAGTRRASLHQLLLCGKTQA